MTEEFRPPPDVPEEVWEELRRIQAEAERMSGVSGAEEPLKWGDEQGSITEDGNVTWEAVGRQPTRPFAYYPDGKPIVDDELLSANMKWALLFEQCGEQRIVGSTKTLYGERLSTVWLGLDHNWGGGPPLIYETMLFAPNRITADERMIVLQARFRAMKELEPEPNDADLVAEDDARRAYLAKHYPHDQLQLRYSTRSEAEDSHEKLKLQCLIPPRWRHFLLWTIGQDPDWSRYNDDYWEY
jgi:hypothetical protein